MVGQLQRDGAAIQTAIDQYREAQKKSGLESESEQKKKDKQ